MSAAAPDQAFGWRIGGALGGLVLLALIGWLAWTWGAVAGLRQAEFGAPASMAALGFVAGAGAFFAPCAFSLFPAYITYYLGTEGAGGARRSMLLGLTCAAGSVVFFALLGSVLTLAGGAIARYLVALKPAIALAVIALGVVQLTNLRMPSLALSWGAGGARAPALGLFTYGFGYALASTGCTLPLYVSITVLPLTSGYPGAALATFLAFAAAMALLMLATTVLVGLARQDLLRALQRSTPWIKRASGVVLILAGLYLGYYYVMAGM